jgi:hypothetical protein
MCVRPPILARAAGSRILLCLVSSLVLVTSASAAEFRRGPDLAAARSNHAAALLQDGRVLVAGSSTSAAAWTTELYDPVQHRWQSGPGLGQAEAAATLTTLLTGKVLLVGQGRQLFDPVTTTWSAPAAAATPHRRHTATLLATGQVLVAGGEARFGGETDALEWYDPINDSATYWGHLNQARRDHAAVRLNSGKVLFAGGRSFGTTLSSVEVFDPQLNYVESSQNGMLAARSGFSLTLLPGGKVLAAGGSDGMANLANAEIYDPASGAWQWTGAMSVPRSGHAATLLPDGRVLVSGGETAPGTAAATAEIYDPASGGWSIAGPLAVARAGHAAVLLPSGSVMLAGGTGSAAAATSSEWFDPAVPQVRFDSLLPNLRTGAIATWLPPGKVLFGGGGMNNDYNAFADVFDTATSSWSGIGLVAGRTRHTQTLLGNGKVLLAGGLYAGTPTAHSELVSGVTSSSTATAPLLTARAAHTASLLADGSVLVAGGYGSDGAAVAATERYRPGLNVWTACAALNTPRADHTATLLDDGRVLVSGGRDATGQVLDSAELYDPATDRWSTLAPMGAARQRATATLLRSGAVLVAGGTDGTDQPLARTDLFDPRTSTWRRGADLTQPRVQHSATLLPSGQVLVAGGRSGPGGGLREVEIYSPEFDRWTPAPLLLQVRAGHSALLLPSGEVLVAFGYANNWVPLLERYDPGLVPDPTRQPRLYPVDLLAGSYGTLRAAGSGFRPAASADSGSGAGAASNLPLLQLQRIDNGQMRFVAADAALPFSDSLFAGRPRDLAAFPVGPVLVRVWVNGIPSAAVQATQAGVPATTTAPLASGGVRRATVTFAPPNDDGGAPIGGYRVTAVPGATLRTCLVPCSAVDFEDLSPGSYTFTVSAVNIAGAAAASAPSNGVVVQARASVILTSGDNPSAYGGSVTFTASVAGQAPGGAVTFRADGTVLCADVALAGGIASCATDALAGGLHAIGASYAGDAGNTAAESATLYQQVDTAASQAALGSSANPSTYGDSVVLTATITARWLDGHVDFHDGAAPLCLQVALSNGVARSTVNDFAVGTHAITARYGGDGDTGASVSFALAQQVLALPTTTSLATPCRHAFSANQPFTLQATIAAAPLGGTPGGQVDFVADSGATLCAAVPLAGGAASCTTTALAAPAGQGQGNVAIRARYSGDAINAGGSSPDLSVTVLDPADVLLRNGFEAAVAGCPAR